MSFLDLRRDYLARSSELLQEESSPSIAATLSKQWLEFNGTDPTRSMHQLTAACPACGSRDLTYRTVWPKPKMHLQKKLRKNKSRSALIVGRALTQRCNTCDRVTKHLMQAPPKARTESSVPLSSNIQRHTLGASKAEIAEPRSTTATTTAKKRAKARKEGLLSLLEKNKQASQPRPGFSLMDFMRH